MAGWNWDCCRLIFRRTVTCPRPGIRPWVSGSSWQSCQYVVNASDFQRFSCGTGPGSGDTSEAIFRDKPAPPHVRSMDYQHVPGSSTGFSILGGDLGTPDEEFWAKATLDPKARFFLPCLGGGACERNSDPAVAFRTGGASRGLCSVRHYRPDFLPGVKPRTSCAFSPPCSPPPPLRVSCCSRSILPHLFHRTISARVQCVGPPPFLWPRHHHNTIPSDQLSLLLPIPPPLPVQSPPATGAGR